MPQSVYIHIPFCTNKCYYCDFNSYVTENQQLIWDYLYALEREMEATIRINPPDQIKTIFVGGGTPTFLSYEQMQYFLTSVQKKIPNQAPDIEFTMEANPGTTDLDKLSIMRQGGVNRLSYGVQAFDDELLKRIGRIHDSAQVMTSIENAKLAGFNNISIDLIFGLPGQTPELFQRTLDQAFSLDLQHFSAYSLKVEENTRFHVLYERNQLILPSEEEEVLMYELVRKEMARHSYLQYEISNFSKPGFESRHNQTYWKNEEYYGMGAGAHGYVKGRRHVNAGPVQQYIQLVQEKELPRVEEFAVAPQEAMEEYMIMGLRLMAGVSESEFQARYGTSLDSVFGEEVKELINIGLLEKTEGRICLTEKGIPLGNEVFMRFLT
ncbi:radical SAM family heme chaperone HemW [Ammoniphilus sp. CFH 90114]|uniref:radical SAM family heme chaperone HemW n=1 Tax=Ammoniphilus sp. CFH 90114 TaxID=2493665 RepID=UPI00100EB8A3|nr:radical SAM family heme chaperone HemW [Ammoniphilus sp. CFH 90114]RXT14809.1 oxygen-independent coproporphyrinogen III oxidase [Ammoniphilus sp. CFH 90114]